LINLPTESGARRNSISVVVPCFNEQDVIRQTHERLSTALSKTDLEYEIVYVNDGSRDRTLQILRELAVADAHVRVISFSRNFGHQVAETAGMDFATGDAVVLIDADLQDPPEMIHDMVRLWHDGYQVVYGTRESRTGESAFKLLSAKYFYRFINSISSVEIPLDTGDFRLMDRRVVDVLKNMPERDRFLRGMVSWVGFKQTALKYARSERVAGGSTFPLRKMARFALDGIVSFSLVPLRLATLCGIISAGVTMVGIIYVLISRLFTGSWASGWTLLLVAAFFLGGMILLSLGIIGEYVGRIYHELKRRPLYVVEEAIGFQNEGMGGMLSRDSG
jgi:glycosyltransferase involved in cell wall biosynthesis